MSYDEFIKSQSLKKGNKMLEKMPTATISAPSGAWGKPHNLVKKLSTPAALNVALPVRVRVPHIVKPPPLPKPGRQASLWGDLVSYDDEYTFYSESSEQSVSDYED